MRVYHLTPSKNLKSILKEGLKVGKNKHFSGPGEISEGIFLGTEPDECYEQFDISDGSPSTRYKGWHYLLSIDLPGGWPLKVDKWNYLYTTKDIPPKLIKGSYSREEILSTVHRNFLKEYKND